MSKTLIALFSAALLSMGAAHAQTGEQGPGGFAQASPGAVADDGAANLLGCGESSAGFRPRNRSPSRLNHDKAPPFGVTPCNI